MTEKELRERAGQIRMIVLDMDGTCLNGEGEMESRTREAIQALADRGYIVVPASGRGFPGLRERVIGVPDIRYVISGDGAVVTDGAAGEVLWSRDIPAAVVAGLAMEIVDRDVIYLGADCGGDHMVVTSRNRDLFDRYYQWNETCVTPEEMSRLVLESGDRFYKLSFYFHAPGSYERYEAIARRFPLSVFRTSGQNRMEFTSQGVSKGSSLRWLCQYLRISREQVCALGDGGNDVEMLAFAGIGVAMGNAQDAARAAADFMAGPNDRYGAAEFLERFFLRG